MQQNDLTRARCLVVSLAVALTVPVTMTACQSPGRAPAAQSPPGAVPTADEASAVLGVKRCRVVRQTVDQTPGQRLSVEMPIDQRQYRIDLWPNSVRAAGYRLLVQGADGGVTDRRAGPLRTLSGAVRGRPGCRVAGAVLQDGLHVVVRLENGRRCWMEPVPRSVAPAHTYAVYDDRDLLPTGGVCRTPGADGPGPLGGQSRDEASHTDTVLIARIACDTDTEFVAAQGSVADAEARINAIINAINLQYEAEVGIRHEITSVLIRTASDPYTATGAQNRLCQFIQEWTNNRSDVERDVAHLFTGANLSGNTIGIAADIGGTGICVSEGGCVGGQFGTFGSYCLAQSDFTASFSCATDLTAHELGHLWGAFHCNCPGSTMNPGITCTNTFSAATIDSIASYRDTRDCLEAAAEDTAVVND